MKSKLEALTEYTEAIADDYKLWSKAETTRESYLQQALHKIAYLIEDGTVDEIELEIQRYIVIDAK